MPTAFDTLYRISSLAQNRQLKQFGFDQNLQGWMDAHRDMILENWWFYHGYHNLFLLRFEKEDESDFMKRCQEATIENHIKPIINLMTSHLYGHQVKRVVKRNGEVDKELQDILQRIVWNQNNIEELDDSKALNSSVTGYTVIAREFIDIRTNESFSPAEDNITKNKYGYVKKTPLDSAFTYLLPYVDRYGIIDCRRVGAVLYFADHSQNPSNIQPTQLLNNAFTDYKVMWYVNDDVWLKWTQNPNDKTWTQITMFPNTKYVNKNPYGKVTIPFSVYKNVGDPYYIEGDSDVFDIRSLNLELNELSNGDKDTIRYHQYPILAAFGCEFPVNWVRTKNTQFEFKDSPKDKADVKYLTWEGKLEASRDKQEQLRRSMSLVSQVSLLSRGFMKDIGQIRSGPPLKALFTSDRALMSRKFAVFKANESQDMMADLQFYKQNVSSLIDIDNTVKCEAIFSEDFLGIDALLEAEIAAIQKQTGTETVEEILRAEHPDWTEEEINKGVKDVEKVSGNRGAATQSPEMKGIQQ